MKNQIAFTTGAAVSLLTAACLLSTPESRADEVQLKLMPTGAMGKLRGYMPQKLDFSTNKPAGITKMPADVTAPIFAELKFGPSESPTTFFVVVDEPEDKPSRLFVDANANGDLTDDAAAEWKTRPAGKSKDGKELVMHMGGAMLSPKYGSETVALHVEMYRFDKNDPNRAALAMSMFYYGDYARTGEVKVGDKTYEAILSDRLTTGDFRAVKDAKQVPALMLDLNGDGKFDLRQESFPVNKPFNIGGTTYEFSGLSASGASFALVKSKETVEETKPMADLSAGKPTIPFQGKTTDGKDVNFPTDYKGKVVLLDFWATWCGPCVAEMPNVIAAYEKLHGQGFEILGVSLDQENAEAKLASFTKEKNMPWPQVYDGKYWEAAVAKKYYVDSIPRAFLVDGDTGAIVAEGNSIRGENLLPAIEKALADKKTK